MAETSPPSLAPIFSGSTIPPTIVPEILEKTEQTHEYDAVKAAILSCILIGCLLLAFCVKRFRIYSLPESAGAMMVGVIVGGIVQVIKRVFWTSTDDPESSTSENFELLTFVSS